LSIPKLYWKAVHWASHGNAVTRNSASVRLRRRTLPAGDLCLVGHPPRLPEIHTLVRTPPELLHGCEIDKCIGSCEWSLLGVTWLDGSSCRRYPPVAVRKFGQSRHGLVPHFFIGAFQRHREVPQRGSIPNFTKCEKRPTGGSSVQLLGQPAEVID